MDEAEPVEDADVVLSYRCKEVNQNHAKTDDLCGARYKSDGVAHEVGEGAVDENRISCPERGLLTSELAQLSRLRKAFCRSRFWR